ncbi:MAG: UbiA family prenyltransferase [Candidatus Parvarchaeota archaeon]|nr:UbiA family prenyltransferase [Candidatus Jingweiarchaeum tengchongense]
MPRLIKKICEFYRIKDWFKNLGLCLIAYTTNVFPTFEIAFLNLIQSSLLLAYFFAMNNFFDFKIAKEKNYIASLKMKDKQILLLCTLPLFLILPTLPIKYNNTFLTLIILFIVLSTLYSCPPRFRDHTIIDVLMNCTIFSVLYLQAYFFFNEKLNNRTILFLFITFTYFLFHELLHQLAHFKKDKKSGRITTAIFLGFNQTIATLKNLLLIYILIAFISIFIFQNLNQFFIVMFVFNLLRYNKIRKINRMTNLQYLRDNVYGIYEWGLYLLLNIGY